MAAPFAYCASISADNPHRGNEPAANHVDPNHGTRLFTPHGGSSRLRSADSEDPRDNEIW